MDELEYEYRPLPSTTERYVVFHVFDSAHNVGLNAALGLPAKDGSCPPFPQLPVKHRKGSKPFAAAGPEPLICLEDDGWRTTDNYKASVARGNISNLMATALCEQVYDEWTCFF